MRVFFRLTIIVVLLQIVAACKSLKRMLPEGPALTKTERAEVLNQPKASIQYTADPKVDFPVFPIQVWAATYELDLILVSQHPDWNMHEYAKLATPEGDLWVMKDAQEGSLDQFVVADLANVEAWLPELPVVRKSYPVKIVDNSTNKMLDMAFEYENIKGQKIKATYVGKHPKTELKKKNGSTMGHSRNQLLVALDLPYRDFGKKAIISYDGEVYKMDKLLGLVPFQMALTQTQGGASSGTLYLESSGDGVQTTHQNNDVAVKQNWVIETKNGGTILKQKNNFRTLTYEFEGTETLELKRAHVQQWNKGERGVDIIFSPALPDLRRPFNGVFKGNFVMDIAGENNNATGTVTAAWKDGKAVFNVQPSKPWWVVDRPMKTVIEYTDKKATIAIEMLPDPTESTVK